VIFILAVQLRPSSKSDCEEDDTQNTTLAVKYIYVLVILAGGRFSYDFHANFILLAKSGGYFILHRAREQRWLEFIILQLSIS